MLIHVDCYAGYRGEETPRRLTLGASRIGIVAVEDRWLAPEHRYFKLIGDDDGLYIVRHDTSKDVWELTFYEAREARSKAPASLRP